MKTRLTRCRFFTLILPLLVAAMLEAQVTNTSYSLPDGDRVLRQEAVMDAPLTKVWKAFTTAEEMRGFIAPVVALDLRPGGVWEASYDPQGTIGAPGNIQNEVLAYAPERMLAIRIKRTPPKFPHPEVGKSVWTVLSFEDIVGGRTRVTIEMLPWKKGPEWDLLYSFFEKGNAVTLARAREYLTNGPVDWNASTSAGALEKLVEAERAFARDGVMLGQREAWLRWFAADGVMFRPGPVNARITMQDSQQAALPAGALFWEPQSGAVAQSGDLGYMTGPVEARDPATPAAPARHSEFFSIWRRDADGQWKVVLDLGARVPQTQSGSRFTYRFTPVATPRSKKHAAATIADVQRLDEQVGPPAPFAEEARALRWNAAPLAGREAIRASDAARSPFRRRTPAGGGMSAAFDLAYTYGSWQRIDSSRGFYARVWRRQDDGSWVIVFEVDRPDPIG